MADGAMEQLPLPTSLAEVETVSPSGGKLAEMRRTNKLMKMTLAVDPRTLPAKPARDHLQGPGSAASLAAVARRMAAGPESDRPPRGQHPLLCCSDTDHQAQPG